MREEVSPPAADEVANGATRATARRLTVTSTALWDRYMTEVWDRVVGPR